MARRLTLDFLKTESGAGLVLAGAALLAVLMANSPWAWRYFAFIGAEIPVRLGSFSETRTLLAWVGDALMPVFFLVLGMQIKFEVLRGELASPRRLGLPIAAAVGGLVVPAAIFLALNWGSADALRGLATPTGSDIACALGVLAVAAPRMPSALRIFLLTVAMADTLGAVALGAAMTTPTVHPRALAGAGLTLALVAVMGWWRRAPFLFYALGFVVIWSFTLESGLSTSLAGVACGLTVPVGARRVGQESVLTYFMDSLHPYVAFGVLPLFAFCASGFAFTGHAPDRLLGAMPIGATLAMIVGKPLGVFGFALLAATLKIGRRPTGVTWIELLGAAMLCGVGFTVSLFLGAMAFSAIPLAQAQVRLAVIIGSLVSAVAGGSLLLWTQAQRTARGEDDLA
jgi:NhaA family Na+:H+ antiporter